LAIETDLKPLLAHVVPFTLVMFRLGGIFALAPTISSTIIPARYKALLTAMLAAAAYPLVAGHITTPSNITIIDLVPLIASEALIGLCIGAIAALPLLSIEMSGVIMGQSMGFGLAQVYNPESDANSEVLGQLLFYIASGIFAAIGGVEQLFGGLLASFKSVPIGAFQVSDTPLDLFVTTLTSGMVLALRVSLPVVAISFLLMVIMGVIGKTMPQLNIMSVGFTIKILAGLGVLVFATTALYETTGDEIRHALADALRWLNTLSYGGAHG
jgi:flagellar biosynthetic protein FliR